MKFSYSWLKEFAKFKESPQKLAEFLALRAFEAGSVVKKGSDWVLDVKLLPNRVADASGHRGMAREIATLKKPQTRNPKSETNSKFEIQNPKLVETKRRAGDVLRVKIENPDDCPRYTARVITGVTVGPSPKWMAERLAACGLQAINNIVDAANYVMLETGQPLHVFDFDRLQTRNHKPETRNKPQIQIPKSKTITVRRARSGERLLALDDKSYHLTPDALVIADEEEPIAIAGIKGGKESGVSAKTKTIVLESANFDPVRTRIASRALGLKTDASYRFEHGMDPNETAPAIDRLAELIQKVAGGEILAGRVDAYPRQLRPAKILLRTDYARRLVGADIPATFFEPSFERLGWGYAEKGRDYVVAPPTVRRDIQIEEDIIEEIVRLWGYEKIRPHSPRFALVLAEPNEERQWETKIKDILVGAGFTEAYRYSFTNRKSIDDFGGDPAIRDYLELENPTSPETELLLRCPSHAYALACRDNLRHFDGVKLFGIAKGFRRNPRPNRAQPAMERKYLLLTQAVKGDRSNESFYELKGVVEQLLDGLGVSDHWFDDAMTPKERKWYRAFHPYRIAEIKVGDEYLGAIGELHPSVVERIKAKARIVVAEIRFEVLWKLARAEAEFRPIGKYPAVIRDIAVVVSDGTKADDVESVIQNAGGRLLADSDLFDYFQDEALTERGQKSLAFHLVFQSPERTLTDEEVNRLFRTIVAVLKQKGWEIRD